MLFSFNPRLLTFAATLFFSSSTVNALAQSAQPSIQPPAALMAKADAGDANAQCSLGLLYQTGLLVPQDYAEAAKWFLKAAKQGNVEAQFQIGASYNKGQGVPQDYAEAAKWFLKELKRATMKRNST